MSKDWPKLGFRTSLVAKKPSPSLMWVKLLVLKLDLHHQISGPTQLYRISSLCSYTSVSDLTKNRPYCVSCKREQPLKMLCTVPYILDNTFLMTWDEYSNFLDKTTTILLLLLSKQFFGDIYEVSEKILGESNSKIHIGVS